MVSAPVIKKLYFHAATFIPSRAIATFSPPIVFFPNTMQLKYPEDDCPPQWSSPGFSRNTHINKFSCALAQISKQ